MEEIDVRVRLFGDISVVFVYGNQWFWSSFCSFGDFSLEIRCPDAEGDFFCLSAFQGYDRFPILYFTRGLFMQNVIK